MRNIKRIIKNNYKVILYVMIGIIAVLLIIYGFIISKTVKKNHYLSNIEEISKNNENPIFSIKELYLFSSANAIDNSINKNLQDLSLYQYSDISILIDNKKTIQKILDISKEKNIKVISKGTENHLMLIDVKSSFNITGKYAEKILDEINITCNKNSIPNETESFTTTSGIRIGTPAMTTRGLKEKEFIEIADIIIDTLQNHDNKENRKTNQDQI